MGPVEAARAKSIGAIREHLAKLGAPELGGASRRTDLPPVPARHRAVAPFLPAAGTGGAFHEVIAAGPGDVPAAAGFALDFAAACARLRPRAGVVLILEDFAAGETGMPYGPGLVLCGLDPGRLLLIQTSRPPDTLGAAETALRSRGVAAVIVETAIPPRQYDLATSRRLLLAARTGGGVGVFLPLAFSGQADAMSSAATLRFEISRARSRTVPFGRALLPLPGRPAIALRLLKAPGHLTNAAARTRDRPSALIIGQSLDEAAFHAFSFRPLPVPADRSHQAAGEPLRRSA